MSVESERISQDRVVKLLDEVLDYNYIGNLKNQNNFCIDKISLKRYLSYAGYSKIISDKAIAELEKITSNQAQNIYDLNKEVYSALRYGIKVRENQGEPPKTVFLINWGKDKVEKNEFAFAEEVTVEGKNTKRPDIVLYVNGIALAVLELKRSCISITEGIRQNLDNQKPFFIKNFFSTIGIIMAGNDTEGLAYGVIETKEKYYVSWKEDEKAKDDISTKVRALREKEEYLLDKNLISMCEKHRFLEIIYDFMVYDRGIKKTCRPNQYFGVKAAQLRIKAREGGIIWHSQGSGKSLTMVWLAKWIKENKNGRVLVITDREELDDQIEKVFKGVGEEIRRTKSGNDLIKMINTYNPAIMCSLIHKFGKHSGELSDSDYEKYIEELKKSLPKDFSPKGDIYVFVDECHRTQSGKLHKAMNAIMPNALYIGFTGTPLLQKDKENSMEIFGSYIHTYKFDEAVADKVVLDLRYEARDVEQYITSQSKIDEWFELQTRGLTDAAKAQLKQRWGTMQKVVSSQPRLKQIASDIMFDMVKKDRLQNGRGNAMLVANSIYEACLYYKIFQNMGFKRCAVVTSYGPNISDIKGESVDGESETETQEKFRIYQEMLSGKDPATFEKEVKAKFVDEPAQMKLLIVVDKLLTGFDAPSATYLYIDKSMRDHGLFQAICRVNRLDDEDKEFGYIVDYKDLFKNIEKAVDDYTSEAFASYDASDVAGLLKNRLDEAKDRLEEIRDDLSALCDQIPFPKGTLERQHYFCGQNNNYVAELKENEPKRLALYKLTAALIRAYAEIAPDMQRAGYSVSQAALIKQEVEDYRRIRDEIKLSSGDYIDLKKYEPDMRHLIDTYINAFDSKILSTFDDMSLIDLIVARGEGAVLELPERIKGSKEAVAETIENNVRRRIIEKTETNPKYFDKMSTLLNELIEERKRQAVDYEEYLKKIVELTRNVERPENDKHYPDEIRKSRACMALYDNIKGVDYTVILDMHNTLLIERQDGWRADPIKSRRIKKIIYKFVGDNDELIEKIYSIMEKQGEY